MKKFELGTVVATVAAMDVAKDNNIRLTALVNRHESGDWGDLSADDLESNESALKHGDRIFSSYDTNGGKFWVITEADRSVTTVLLPSDY